MHVEHITTEPDIAGSISGTGNTWGLKITDKYRKVNAFALQTATGRPFSCLDVVHVKWRMGGEVQYIVEMVSSISTLVRNTLTLK